MYFRFGVAILLVVAISVLGVALEKSTLGFQREITRQQFRKDVLHEEHERLRLQTQQLGSPTRLQQTVDSRDQSTPTAKRKRNAANASNHRPLLRWQRRSPE